MSPVLFRNVEASAYILAFRIFSTEVIEETLVKMNSFPHESFTLNYATCQSIIFYITALETLLMDKDGEQSPWDELLKVSHTLSLREPVIKIDA